MAILDGYPIVFGKPGMLGKEIIPQDAVIHFTKEVRLLVKHDEQIEVLASTADGSLVISRDQHGIRMIAAVNESTPYAKEFMDLYRKHKGAGKMSFGFRAISDQVQAGVRSLREIMVDEFSLVANPAYPDTSVDVVDMGRIEAELALIKLGNIA